jgi:hypothetical protein
VSNQPSDNSDQATSDAPPVQRSKRRRWYTAAAATVPPLIVGLILLVPDKGFDLLFDPDATPPASTKTTTTTQTDPTAVISSTAPESSTITTVPPVPPPQAVTTASQVLVNPSPVRQPPVASNPAVLARGHARIINVEGFDLDNGQKADQNVPGMDISPDKEVTLINAMSHGTPRMAPLPRSAASAYARCQELPSTAYVQVFKDIRLMHVGDHICVRTNLDNCSMITLTEVPSDAARYLAFDYISWGIPCRRP